MFCPNCGSNIEDGSKFCGECGKSINASLAELEQKKNEKSSTKPAKKNSKGGLVVCITACVAILAAVAIVITSVLSEGKYFSVINDLIIGDSDNNVSDNETDDKDVETAVLTGADTVEEIETAVGDLFNGKLDYETYQKRYCLPNREKFYESFCNIIYNEYYAAEGYSLDEVKEEFEGLDGIKFYYEWLSEKELESVAVDAAEKVTESDNEFYWAIREAFTEAYPNVKLYEFYGINFKIWYTGDKTFYWTDLIIAQTENGFVIICNG